MNTVTAASHTGLAGLVEDAASFHAEVWGQRSRKFSPPSPPPGPTIADIWSMLECGLLVAPYFTVVKGGIPVRATQTRVVLQRPVPNYADAAAVRKLVDDGYVLKVNQPEDWSLPIRLLLKDVQTQLRAQTQAQVWLCPPHAEFLNEADPPYHRFLLQLDGQATWLTSADDEFSLLPGELLYLPNHCGYTATAQESASLFLAIAVQPPTAGDIAELALANFLESPPAKRIEGTHHRMTPAEKISWLRAEFGAYLGSLDLDSLLAEAVSVRQQEDRA